MRVRALLLIAMLSSNGCALVVSSNASHNSGGRACVSSPIPATIDLVLASGMLAIVATQDAHPGYYTLPGLFFASGVIGGISAARCAGNEQKTSPSSSPPLSNSAPSFGNAEVDPEARPATPEDLGTPPDEPPIATETIGPHPAGPKLTLDPTYQIGPGKPPPPATPIEQPVNKDERITCRDAPGSCPKGQTCAIAGSDAGFCVHDRGR